MDNLSSPTLGSLIPCPPATSSQKTLNSTAIKVAKVVAVTLVLIGAIALVLLYAPVLTPAILLALSLTATSVQIFGISSLAAGGLGCLALFAIKSTRKHIDIESTRKHIDVENITKPYVIPLPEPTPIPTPIQLPEMEPEIKEVDARSIYLGITEAEIKELPIPTPQELAEKLKKILATPHTPPSEKIDNALISGIFGDAFSSKAMINGVSLEGATMLGAAKFIHAQVLKEKEKVLEEIENEHPTKEQLPECQSTLDYYNHLLNSIGQVIEVEELALKIRGSSDSSRLFTLWMQNKIEGMKVGDRFLVPGGWTSNPGHALLYEMICEGDDFTFNVVNTGSGIKYHPSAFIGVKRKYQNILSLKCTRQDLMRQEVWLGHYNLMYVKPDHPYEAYDVYRKFLVSISPSFNRSSSSDPLSELTALFSTPQATGNCTTKVFFAFMKAYSPKNKTNITSKKGYKKLKIAIRKRSLEIYMNFQQKEGLFLMPIHKGRQLAIFYQQKTIRSKLGHLHFIEACIDKFSRSIGKALKTGPKLEGDIKTKREDAIEESWISDKEAAEINDLLRTAKAQCKTFKETLLEVLIETVPDIYPSLTSTVTAEALPIASGKEHSSEIAISFPLDRWGEIFKLKIDWKKPSSLQESLGEYLKVFSMKNNSKDFSDIRVYYALRNLFYNLPVASDVFWSQVPKEQAELCMSYIADLSETFIRTQWTLPESDRIRINDRFLMQKTLFAMQELAKRLPNDDENGVSLCIIAPSYLLQDSTAKAQSSRFGFTTDPRIERDLIASLSRLESDAMRSLSRSTTSRMFEVNETDFREDQGRKTIARFKNSTTDMGYDPPFFNTEAQFIWKYLSTHLSVLEALKKQIYDRIQAINEQLNGSENEFYRERVIPLSRYQDVPDHFCVAEAMECTILPIGFNALRKQAVLTQLMHVHAFNAKKTTDSKFETMKYSIFYVTEYSWPMKEASVYLVLNPAFELDAVGSRARAFQETHHQVSNLGIQQLLETSKNATQNEIMISMGWDKSSKLTEEEYHDLYLLHSSDDPSQQVINTIAYFSQNIGKLTDRDFQLFFMSLIFERGVLKEQLRNDKDFIHILNAFVLKGREYSKINNELATELFFLRMNDYFQAYFQHVLDEGEIKSKDEESKLEASTLEGDSKQQLESPEILRELRELMDDPELMKDDKSKSLLIRDFLAAQNRRRNPLSNTEIGEALKFLFYYHHQPMVQYSPIEISLEDDILELKNKILISLQDKSKSQINEILDLATGIKNGIWILTNFPYVTCEIPPIHIDLIHGILFTQEETFNHSAILPQSVRDNALIQILFTSTKMMNVKSNGGQKYKLTDQFDYENIINSIPIVGTGVERKINLFTLYDFLPVSLKAKAKIKGGYLWFNLESACGEDSNSNFSRNCSRWSYPGSNFYLYINNITGKIQFIHHELGITSVEEDGSYGMHYLIDREITTPAMSFLNAIDPNTEVWMKRSKADGFKVDLVDLPRFNMQFQINEKTRKIIYTKEPRYHLTTKIIPSLSRYSGDFVLEDETTKQRRAFLVDKLLNNDRETADLSASISSPPRRLKDEHTIYEYQMDAKGELKCTDLPGKLFLVYRYLSTRDTRRAQKILKEVSLLNKMQAYSKKEIELLTLIITSTDGNDQDFKACALRLKALALLIENANKYNTPLFVPNKHQKEIIDNDIDRYLSQLSHAKSFHLNHKECRLLEKIANSENWERHLLVISKKFGESQSRSIHHIEEITAPTSTFFSFGSPPEDWAKRIGSTPADWVSRIDENILDKKITTDPASLLKKNFLSFYYIARNGSLKERIRLLSYLAWTNLKHENGYITTILRLVANNPGNFPTATTVVNGFKKPLTTKSKHDFLRREILELETNFNKLQTEWVESISDIIVNLVSHLPKGNSSFQTTIDQFPLPTPIVHAKEVRPIDLLGSIASPSLFSSAYLFGEGDIEESFIENISRESEFKIKSEESPSPKALLHLAYRNSLLHAERAENIRLLAAAGTPCFSRIPILPVTASVEGDSKRTSASADESRSQELLDRIKEQGGKAISQVESRGFEELRADVADHLKIKAARSPEMAFNKEQLPRLKLDLESKFKAETTRVDELEDQILNLANQAPDPLKEPRKNLRRAFNREHADVRDPINLDELLILIFRNDANAIKRRNKALSMDDITLLKAQVELFLVRKTHQQQIARALSLANQLQANLPVNTRHEKTQALLLELTAKRNYEIPDKNKAGQQNYFIFLLIEYHRNTLLRSDQVKDVEKLFTDTINSVLQIPMGAGKTQFLLVLLALHKANGKQLSIVMLPDELKAIVAEQMQVSGGLIYQQTAHQIDWSQVNTWAGLNSIKKQLLDIIANRGFLIVSNTEMHNFALSARENRWSCSKGGLQRDLLLANEKLFREIKEILNTQGNVIIDEIDLQINCRREVHKALGAPVQVDEIYGNITAAMFNTLKSNETLSSLFYFEDLMGTRKTGAIPFSSGVKDQDPKRYAEFETILATAGLNYLTNNMDYAFLKDYSKSLIEYLIAPVGATLTLPLEIKDQKLLDALGYIKGMVKVFLPITLQKRHKENYDLLPNADGSRTLLAGPCDAQKPQIGSEFAHFAEQMAYTTLCYLKDGIPAELIKKELLAIRDKVKVEMANNKKINLPQQTKAYKEFVAMCGDLPIDSKTLMTGRDRDIAFLAKQISSQSKQIIYFVRKYIFPSIKLYTARISSNAQTLSIMFKNVKQGFAGTLANKDTFHADFTTERRPGVDGKTVNLLWERSRNAINIIPEYTAESLSDEADSKVSASSSSSKKSKTALEKAQEKGIYYLQKTLKNPNIGEYRAIIDLGGTFQDTPSEMLAKEILLQRPELTAVFYFNGDKPMTLKRNPTRAATVIEGHPPEIKPEDRFTIYGQRQCTGTHLDQMATAKAFVTINKNSNLRDLLQAVWRMRGIEKGQKISFIIQQDLVNIIKSSLGKTTELDVLDLMLYVEKNQTRQQAEDNLMSTRQKMQNIVFEACDSLLDRVPIDHLGNTPYRELNELTLSILTNSPFMQFARIERLVDARECLLKNMEEIISPLEKWCLKYPDIINNSSLTRSLKAQMIALIDKTINEHLVNAQLPMPVDKPIGIATPDIPVGQGVAVTVSVQAQVAIRQEAQVRQEVEQKQEHARVNRNVSPILHSKWKNSRNFTKFDFFKPISYEEAIDSRNFTEFDFSKPFLYEEAAAKATHQGNSTPVFVGTAFKRKILEKIFNDPNFMISLDLGFTECGGEFFGIHQKPIDRAVIVVGSSGEVKLLMADGSDIEQFRHHLKIKRLENARIRGDEVERKVKEEADNEAEIYLIHTSPAIGIFDQLSTKKMNLDQLKKENPKLQLMLIQMKLIAGETYYEEEEQIIMKNWLSSLKLTSAELELFEECIRTYIIKRPSVRNHYAESSLAEVFEQLRPPKLAVEVR